MKKKDLIIIALALVCALALWLVSQLALGTEASSVVVLLDGEEVLRKPLVVSGDYEIAQEDGSKNVIRMMADGFYMEEASCPDQRCVQQGKVTQSNWYLRSLGVQVICLPNRVTVELKLADQQQMDQHIDAPDV